MMARYLHARLDILLCSQIQRRAASPTQARQWLEEEWQYMAALRRSIVAPDVEIGVDIASNETVSDAVVSRVRQKKYALVVKAPWHSQPGKLDPNDWQLMRRCPAPLLLTQGKTWQPQARFLVALDGLNTRSALKYEAVLEAASAMRVACGARLDLVDVEPVVARSEPAAASETPPLERLAQEFDIDVSHLHRLHGPVGDILRQFVTDREYDLIVVGAPTAVHVPWSASNDLALAGGLSSADCDLLTINHRVNAQPVLSGRRRLRWNRFPLWQWLGAD